jgi:hypothetical protein
VDAPGAPAALLRGLADADVELPGQVSFLTFGDSPWAARDSNPEPPG